MPTLTVDHARALAGPAWLRARRAAAAERLADVPMPTTEEEVWRYSRIAELDLDAFAPLTAGAASLGRVRAPVGVVTVDGVSGTVRVSEELAARGVSVSVTGDEEALGSVLSEPVDRFALMNDAFAASPVVLRVPRGVVLPEPVVVRHHIATDGVAAFPRLVVVAGEDSELTILEHFTSGDVRALVVPVLELQAQPAARVRYLAVNALGSRVWTIGHQVASGDKDSSTLLSTVALGGDYARVRTESRLIGTGAEARQIAVYFGEGSQMHDFRTLQEHVAPKTTSDLLFKGAVEDNARSVYTGLIHIGKHAKGSAAFQTNRNIKLSEGAWAESVPNLDIENNDVRCSHASAVGPIDEEQRFYLESRGVPPAVAERLIVLGFFSEVIERLPVPALAAQLRQQVSDKLDPEVGMSQTVTVGPLTDLVPGSATRVDVAGHRICVVRIGDDVYAIGDTCSHAEVSLSLGEVFADTKEIECEKHGSLFSLETGEALTLPATQPVPVYEAKVVDGQIVVEVT